MRFPKVLGIQGHESEKREMRNEIAPEVFLISTSFDSQDFEAISFLISHFSFLIFMSLDPQDFLGNLISHFSFLVYRFPEQSPVSVLFSIFSIFLFFYFVHSPVSGLRSLRLLRQSPVSGLQSLTRLF